MSLPNELEFPGWSDHNATGPRFSSLGSRSIFLWLDPFSPPLIVMGFVLTPCVDPRAERLLGWETYAVVGAEAAH